MQYARIENNVVAEVVESPSMPPGTSHWVLVPPNPEGYPEPVEAGWGYSEYHSAFHGPAHYPSWTFNPRELMWEPSVPRPQWDWPIVPRWNESVRGWEQLDLTPVEPDRE